MSLNIQKIESQCLNSTLPWTQIKSPLSFLGRLKLGVLFLNHCIKFKIVKIRRYWLMQYSDQIKVLASQLS